MNSFAASQEYQQAIQLLDALSVEEQLRLITEISGHLRLKMQSSSSTSSEKAAKIEAICGKYAHVQTSSEEFALRKQEEIAREG